MNCNSKSPWMSVETSQIRQPTIRFHNEIIDFYKYMTNNGKEETRRVEAMDLVFQILKSIVPNASLKVFGSQYSKLYLPGADIDIAILDSNYTQKELYRIVAAKITNRPEFTNLTLLASAKVPIIKCVEKSSKIQFDLSFNQQDGLQQNELIDKAKLIYPELPYMLLVLKCMLKQRGLNETYTGGIGSYLLCLLILQFLRFFRKLYQKQNETADTLENVSLGELLSKFMDFYGNKFDYKNKKILMADGGQIINKSNDDRLTLITQGNIDIGQSSFKFRDVVNLFKNRYNILTNYNFQDNESVLGYILNPSEQDFVYTIE